MKRVLLKLSGEALAGDKKTGFDEATCMGVAKQVKTLADAEMCIRDREKVAKENNASVTVRKFVRYETGEGIEKKVDDFAAEVAAQAGM